MAAPNLEPKSPLVGRERGAQALRRESRTPGYYGHVVWGSGALGLDLTEPGLC